MKLRLFVAAFAAVAALSPAAMAQTESLSFSLTNNTEYTMTHLYLSVPSTNSWEQDILGAQVVGSGETVDVTIDDGLEDCEYDIRADFSDGDSVQVGSVDFCSLDGSELSID